MRSLSLGAVALAVLLTGCGSSSSSDAPGATNTKGGTSGSSGAGGGSGDLGGTGGASAGTGGSAFAGASSAGGNAGASGAAGSSGTSGAAGGSSFVCTPASPTTFADPLTLVVPTMGTGGYGYGAGNNFPGAAIPHGLAKVGPDTTDTLTSDPTRFIHYDGYYFSDANIIGFTHLHMSGTGAADYGVLSVMPGDGFDSSRITPNGYASTYQKPSEVATPGFYGVTLDRGGIDVGITVDAHAAIHRYTFNGSVEHHVLFDLGKHLDGGTVKAESLSLDPTTNSLRGTFHSDGGMSSGFGGYDVYFSAQLSEAWTTSTPWADGKVLATSNAISGDSIGVDFAFDPSSASPVFLRIGVSLVSAMGADMNLAAEIADFDFDAHKKAAEAKWSAQLGKIRVTGGCVEDQTTLYSSLYHAFLMPAQMSDVDGSYMLSDGKVHNAPDFRFFSDMSFWDTYRTVHPLYALIAPDSERDSLKTLEAFFQTFDFFPKWPIAWGESGTMVGSSAEIVIADGYLKGYTDFDAETVYQGLRAAAMDPTTPMGGRGGRDQVVPYMQYGYVPESSTQWKSVSITLEYARDDFALAAFAKALGHDDDATALSLRALGYQKLFDPMTGFLRGKAADGTWLPTTVNATGFGSDGYVEATAWQTIWGVPNDIAGLVNLYGGQQPFIDQLTTFFTKSVAEQASVNPNDLLETAAPRKYYFAGNEPDIHVPYMFAQAGRPDLTQQWARWAQQTYFSATPGGIPGNDDGGTMSSWFLFNALGFMPLPGTDEYILGAPSFPHAELDTPGGMVTIDATGAGPDAPYVQTAMLNGQPMTSAIFHQGDIGTGGKIEVAMGTAASTWGRGE